MSPEETASYYKAVKNDLNDKEVLDEAVDLASCKHMSLQDIIGVPELNRFFGGEEESWSEFLAMGLNSLRTGFYKICEKPFLNIHITPHTFSSYVYYFHPENDVLIKYRANIGPMSNIHAGYSALPGTIGHGSEGLPYIKVLNKFANERNIIGNPLNHYQIPKQNFFDSLYLEGTIFYVIKSIFDPEFPNTNPRPKKVIWSFLD